MKEQNRYEKRNNKTRSSTQTQPVSLSVTVPYSTFTCISRGRVEAVLKATNRTESPRTREDISEKGILQYSSMQKVPIYQAKTEIIHINSLHAQINA